MDFRTTIRDLDAALAFFEAAVDHPKHRTAIAQQLDPDEMENTFAVALEQARSFKAAHEHGETPHPSADGCHCFVCVNTRFHGSCSLTDEVLLEFCRILNETDDKLVLGDLMAMIADHTKVIYGRRISYKRYHARASSFVTFMHHKGMLEDNKFTQKALDYFGV